MQPATDHVSSKVILTAHSMSPENRGEMRRVFDRLIKLADHGQVRLRVPREVATLQKLRGMHYHYRPEIFFQLQGRTDFRFPRESFEVQEDEICIIPTGLPHGEIVQGSDSRPFRNLVAAFYNNTLSLHFAWEALPHQPEIEVIEFFDAPNLDVFLSLTNTLAHTFSTKGPARDAVVKGLLLALLGLFRNIVETGTGHLNNDMGKVFQAKCLVREQFASPDLCVQNIAKSLNCSADYLSHLFQVETKERLTHYIQRIRVESATLALNDSTLTVAEIAYATGFSDPAYFARVFKQHKEASPQEYRLQLAARRTQPESQPKTVYSDRIDFSPGVPFKKTPGLPPSTTD